MGGGALDKRESRSIRALEELAVEGAVDWEREEEKGAPLEEEVELAGMGGASGMNAGCKKILATFQLIFPPIFLAVQYTIGWV